MNIDFCGQRGLNILAKRLLGIAIGGCELGKEEIFQNAR
jgi:hypothetical protein